MIISDYWKNRKESILTESYGCYKLSIRYFADDNHAQVSMHDISNLRFPLLWSAVVTDEQANSALELFKNVGFFNLAC